MLGGGPALQRQGVGGEPGGADDGDPGQRGQDLPVGAREQLDELVLERGAVLRQAQPPLDVAAEPLGTQLGVGRRRQQPLPALDPEARVGLAEAAG